MPPATAPVVGDTANTAASGTYSNRIVGDDTKWRQSLDTSKDTISGTEAGVEHRSAPAPSTVASTVTAPPDVANLQQGLPPGTLSSKPVPVTVRCVEPLAGPNTGETE